MKKWNILTLCLAFGFSQSLMHQLHFGVKGGLNYNSNSLKS